MDWTESQIREHLLENYGIKLPQGMMFEENQKIFLYTGVEIDLSGRRGIYIAKINKDIRPSVNITHLAKKNILDVSESDAKTWMCGLDIKGDAEGPYVMIRFDGYIIGIGKPKEGRIINNLPKNRRLPLNTMG